ncbi:MAG: hypothetical protein COC01_09695 [Bacteroidetes bacterium]|nr:hypothetical protein [Bacteroidia bacterium]PCH65451.1 MAG: hypothetical protein COC01_09695 [Bacteroidota bacterium]
MKDSDIPKTSANDSITAPNCDSSYKSIIHFSKWRSESGWISRGAAYDIITDYTEIYELLDSIVNLDNQNYYVVSKMSYMIDTKYDNYNPSSPTTITKSDTTIQYNYIREDYCNKKVYLYLYEKDCLLYNFNKQIGDTLKADSSCERTIDLTIQTIDSIIVGNETYKKINCDYKYSDEYPFFLIEGIGCRFGLLQDYFIDYEYFQDWAFYSFWFNGEEIK